MEQQIVDVVDITSIVEELTDETGTVIRKRIREDYGNLEELTESIRTTGIIHPIAVNRRDDGTLLLLAGGRRLRACIAAGVERVPVRVFPKELSEYDFRTIELMENLQRKALTWQEELKFKKELLETKIAQSREDVNTGKADKVWGRAEVAKLLGESNSNFSNDIKLADAISTKVAALEKEHPEVAERIKNAENKYTAQKMLDKLEESLIQEELARRAQANMSRPENAGRKALCDRYIIGDFFEGVKNIKDGTIDFVECDPPFAIDYTETKKFVDEGRRDTDQYNEIDKNDYPFFLQNMCRECARVMKEGAWMVVWHAAQWTPLLREELQKAGLKVATVPGIWYKTDGVGGQTMNPDFNLGNTYEVFLYARKGNGTLAKKGRSNVFAFDRVLQSRRRHPTIKPIPLLMEILNTFMQPGGTVLCPFLGSGNTILACSNTHRECLGFEKTEAYKNSFVLAVNEREVGKYE